MGHMTRQDRETLLLCASTILELTATLNYWEKHTQHGRIADIRSMKQFQLLEQRVSLHLEAMSGSVASPPSDETLFETLRSFLKALDAPTRPL
jgi:hypothetical protein